VQVLKLKVVTESVVTDAQLRLLLSFNSVEVQCYLFSNPVPAEMFHARCLTPFSTG